MLSSWRQWLLAAARLCGSALVVWLSACRPAPATVSSQGLPELRVTARKSDDGERVGRWLLYELLASGGQIDAAAEARKKLAKLGSRGMVASLARALDADSQGRFLDAGRAYLATLQAARVARASESSLVAWFAARRLGELRVALGPLDASLRRTLDTILAQPGGVGWRGRAELLALWASEQLKIDERVSRQEVLRAVVERSGCVTEMTLAGPFGRGSLADQRVHYEPEKPAPWPPRFRSAAGERALRRPHSRVGCTVRARDATPHGVYYVQTFIELDAPREVIIAVHAARAVFVDDAEVLTRDRGDWGVWPRFGVRLALAAGRHRIVARLPKPETAIRVVSPDGTPLGLRGSAADEPLYVTSAPRILADPNPLAAIMKRVGVQPPAGWPSVDAELFSDEPVWRYLAAYLAHVDGQDDLASVMQEPLVAKLDKATPLALAQQAVFVTGDPVFPSGAARDLARDLRQRARKRDASLWEPRLWLLLDKATSRRGEEATKELEALAEAFPEVPAVHRELISLYRRLGWTAEHLRALQQASHRFPADVDLLSALVAERERRGAHKVAEQLRKRVRALDGQEELTFRRALRQQNYDAAIEELKRLGRQREDRRAIAARIEDLMIRAGKAQGGIAKLEHALAQEPQSDAARLAVADAKLAAGDESALTSALVEAIRTGAPNRRLRAAIELVEGMTDLEPFRRDGRAIIEKSKGLRMPGTAARILDYGALWIEADGRSRMLEHEIIRIQSREAIAEHAEQRVGRGMVLSLRTIKSDGRVFEPELVTGKPTVTMPHLEVGDYIETETIWMLSGPDGEGGKRYQAPRWYFREKNISYHLSEFVVISPEQRPLEIETTGQVPAPSVTRDAGLITRRWRVKRSPALPQEPLSAPAREFLPSVQLGWGVTVDDQLRRWMQEQAVEVPPDPRMQRIAQAIAGKGSEQSKVQRLYRWVLDNVQRGKEQHGPRIVMGRAGNRVQAFVYLSRMLSIDVRLGVVKNRLQAPARGPFSRAMSYNVPAVRVHTDERKTWMLIGDRYAPFGYLPSALRGQEAVLLESKSRRVSPAPREIVRERTPEKGVDDGIAHDGTVTLAADGSARFDLRQTYSGRFAILLRNVLSKVPAARHKEVVETKLLGSSLPGVRVLQLKVERLDQLDEPVVLQMKLEVPNFARGQSKPVPPPLSPVGEPTQNAPSDLVISTPFLAKVEELARLPHRQSPLYISNRMATHTSVSLEIELPPGAKLVGVLKTAEIRSDRLRVKVDDDYHDGKLILRRDLDVTAGRVQPEVYERFRAQVREADALLRQTLRLRM